MVENTPGYACVQGHTVMIYDRGGKKRLDQLVDLTQVNWGRVRDTISSAKITISGRACRAQSDKINKIEPKRHEIVIFRGKDRVWEGPIQNVSWYSDRVVIDADDVFRYIAGTVLSKEWPNSDNGGSTYMTDRVQQMMTYELTTPYVMKTNSGNVTVKRWEGISTPANILPFMDVRSSTGILTRAVTEPFEMTLGNHLDALSQGGLDYAAIGRKMLIWDGTQALGRTRKLTDADFYGNLVVIASGSDHVSISHTYAQEQQDTPPGGEPLPPINRVGSAGAENDYYGVWSTITPLESEQGSDEITQTELNSQAQRGLTGRTPVPIILQVPDDAGLKLSHDLQINDLVPGVDMPVQATLNLKPVVQNQRLHKMTVSETAAGERIGVTLLPQGISSVTSRTQRDLLQSFSRRISAVERRG